MLITPAVASVFLNQLSLNHSLNKSISGWLICSHYTHSNAMKYSSRYLTLVEIIKILLHYAAQSYGNWGTIPRNWEKMTENDDFFARYLTLLEKQIIPAHYVFAYDHSTHFHAIWAQSYENCGTIPQNCERNDKNQGGYRNIWPWGKRL